MGDFMKDDKQTINCSVYDCKHCNVDDNKCVLKEIKVANCNHNNDKEATMCDSYKKRK